MTCPLCQRSCCTCLIGLLTQSKKITKARAAPMRALAVVIRPLSEDKNFSLEEGMDFLQDSQQQNTLSTIIELPQLESIINQAALVVNRVANEATVIPTRPLNESNEGSTFFDDESFGGSDTGESLEEYNSELSQPEINSNDIQEELQQAPVFFDSEDFQENLSQQSEESDSHTDTFCWENNELKEIITL